MLRAGKESNTYKLYVCNFTPCSRAWASRLCRVERTQCVSRIASLFFFLASFCNESLSLLTIFGSGPRLFSQKKTGKNTGRKKKEKKSPAHVSQFVVLLILFFVSFCLKSVCKEPNKIAPHFFFFFCHLSRMVRST